MKLWADGGMIGRGNPSPLGVYCSVFCEGEGVVARASDRKKHTNNDAEWLALYTALEYARDNNAARVVVHMDSRFVVEQFNNRWRAKIERHARMLHRCRHMVRKHFTDVVVVWVPREELVGRVGH